MQEPTPILFILDEDIVLTEHERDCLLDDGLIVPLPGDFVELYIPAPDARIKEVWATLTELQEENA